MPSDARPTRFMATPDGSPPHSGKTHPATPHPRISLRLEDGLAVVLMAALACITFANVVVRYFTDRSFAWTEEISVFLMIMVTMVAGCAAFARNLHIRIEVIADSGSPARQRRCALVSYLIIALFFLLLTVLSGRLAWDEYRYEETSPAIGIPSWWYSAWLPVLSAAIALRALGAWRRLRVHHQQSRSA